MSFVTLVSSNNGRYADITEADSEASQNKGLLPTKAGKEAPPEIPVLSENGRHADITEAHYESLEYRNVNSESGQGDSFIHPSQLYLLWVGTLTSSSLVSY